MTLATLASVAVSVAGSGLAVALVSAASIKRDRRHWRTVAMEEDARRSLDHLAEKIREADQWNRQWDESIERARRAAITPAPTPVTAPDALTVRRPLTPATRCDEDVCPPWGCTACIKVLEQLRKEIERKSCDGLAVYVAERTEPVRYIDTPGAGSCPCMACSRPMRPYEPPSADRVRK